MYLKAKYTSSFTELLKDILRVLNILLFNHIDVYYPYHWHFLTSMFFNLINNVYTSIKQSSVLVSILNVECGKSYTEFLETCGALFTTLWLSSEETEVASKNLNICRYDKTKHRSLQFSVYATNYKVGLWTNNSAN